VFPVRSELGVYITEGSILHSDRRGNLKSYIVLSAFNLLIGWTDFKPEAGKRVFPGTSLNCYWTTEQ
jgi:hypothetical protein